MVTVKATTFLALKAGSSVVEPEPDFLAGAGSGEKAPAPDPAPDPAPGCCCLA